MHKRRLGVVLATVLAIVTVFLPLRQAAAAQLTNRSVSVSSASPSVSASHNFQFTYVSISNIGSIVFEYCDSPVFAYPCNAPVGLDVSGATIASQSGNVGFSVDNANTTANRLVLTRPALPALAASSQYSFGNIINPSQPNVTTYIRLTTYASTDGSGAYTDYGAVAFATISPFNVASAVPPFLQLCVGISVSIDCAAASGDQVNLGTLSPLAARAGQSQLSGGTNSINGYAVYILGSTLTSGNDTIPALSSPTPSCPGNSQFGINLRANTNPAVGSDPAGPGSTAPTANYNLPNLFMLNSGDAIVTDNLPSDYKRMTVSYMANINNSQPPGVYNTTFTYVAIAQF